MKADIIPLLQEDRAAADAEDKMDLFILAAEPSADLHGANLIKEIFKLRPSLQIGAVAGPKMRELPISAFFKMENLCVMGFIDVIRALPKIIQQFFLIKKKIIDLNPKVLVCIDYPGFNLRLEKALRKKGYRGKIVHYISPTVWVWGKKRVDVLAKTVDLLLTFFPFEKPYFSHTPLCVHYVGHPLIAQIPLETSPKRKKLLALFPGSRQKEIERNFPIQLKVAKKLLELDPHLEIGVSVSHLDKMELLRRLSQKMAIIFYPPEKNYDLMRSAQLALATSGTVTLELALHSTPTIVQFAVHPIDLFIVRKILRIHLPFYCIVNILASRSVFPELFGPQLTEEQLFFWVQKLWFHEPYRKQMEEECRSIRSSLSEKNANSQAAEAVISLAF